MPVADMIHTYFMPSGMYDIFPIDPTLAYFSSNLHPNAIHGNNAEFNSHVDAAVARGDEWIVIDSEYVLNVSGSQPDECGRRMETYLGRQLIDATDPWTRDPFDLDVGGTPYPGHADPEPMYIWAMNQIRGENAYWMNERAPGIKRLYYITQHEFSFAESIVDELVEQWVDDFCATLTNGYPDETPVPSPWSYAGNCALVCECYLTSTERASFAGAAALAASTNITQPALIATKLQAREALGNIPHIPIFLGLSHRDFVDSDANKGNFVSYEHCRMMAEAAQLAGVFDGIGWYDFWTAGGQVTLDREVQGFYRYLHELRDLRNKGGTRRPIAAGTELLTQPGIRGWQ